MGNSTIVIVGSMITLPVTPLCAAMLCLAASAWGQESTSLPESLRRDLVVYLPFEGNVRPQGNTTYAGSISGNPQYVAGKLGKCLQFDEMATPKQYVTLPESDTLYYTVADSFTVSVWVNHAGSFPDNTKIGGSYNDPAIISNKDWKLGTYAGWAIAAGPDGRWQWNAGDGKKRVDYDSEAGLITDGQWHQICVVVDRDLKHASMYFDGELQKIVSLSTIGSFNSEHRIAIATDGAKARNLATWFTGKIDEVMIWQRALTAEQVQQVYKR